MVTPSSLTGAGCAAAMPAVSVEANNKDRITRIFTEASLSSWIAGCSTMRDCDQPSFKLSRAFGTGHGRFAFRWQALIPPLGNCRAVICASSSSNARKTKAQWSLQAIGGLVPSCRWEKEQAMWNHDKALAIGLAVVVLAGCATSGPEYRPRDPGGSVGYTDLQLSPNRYRVSFAGSSASTRDDVEVYLLRRAAEVTLQAGYTHFVLERSDTERDTRYVADPSYYGSYYGPYYGYGPYYRPYYYPYRSYYWGSPYWSAWPVTSYSANAEVVMMDSDQAARNPEAIDALALLQRLWPPAPVPVASAAQRSRNAAN